MAPPYFLTIEYIKQFVSPTSILIYNPQSQSNLNFKILIDQTFKSMILKKYNFY